MDTQTQLIKLNELLEILTYAKSAIDSTYTATNFELEQAKKDLVQAQMELDPIKQERDNLKQALADIQTLNASVTV